MNNDRLYELISRKLAGEATPAELEELHEYFQKNPHDQYFTELISSYWNSRQENDEQDEIDSDEHFNHILELAGTESENNSIQFEDPALAAFEARNKRRRINARLSIAASLLILLGLSWWFFSKQSNVIANPVRQSEIVANKGFRSRITLPDSSVVILNSDTKLNYPQQFKENLREVYLDGEAYFEVKKNPSKPFIVHTSGMEVKVLGTSFNVKAYSADKLIETSLITGSIEVFVKNRPNEKIILSPHEKLIVKNYKAPVTSQTTEGEKEIAVKPEIAINQLKPDPKDSTFIETQWVEDKLVFRDKSFEDVATMMERWYDVSIDINDDELKHTLLTGTFKNETIEQALDGLRFTKNFQFRKIGSVIKINK